MTKSKTPQNNLQDNPDQNPTAVDTPVRPKRKKADAQPTDKENTTATRRKRSKTPKNPKVSDTHLVAKEALLEFVEHEDGTLVLREVGDDEPLVSISFADKIKELVGQENIPTIGQHMIQAAISSFMQRQMNQWHAHVYEEVPQHFN